jgi:CHAT domain-containing protein/Tfp pilus assembly protein PilF
MATLHASSLRHTFLALTLLASAGPQHAALSQVPERQGRQGRAGGQAGPSPLQEKSIAEAKRLTTQALGLEAQRKYDEALSLEENALGILEQALGPNDPEVAHALNILAHLHRRKKDYARAEPLLHRAIRIAETSLGPEHKDVGMFLTNLGLLWIEKEDYALAEPALERALGIFERRLELSDPALALTLEGLARVYVEKADFARAEPMYRRAIGIVEQRFGAEYPNLIFILRGLAQLYRYTGDYARAEMLLQRAVKISEKAYGAERPETAVQIRHLASAYYEGGDYDQAETLYRRALLILERSLGPDDLEVDTVLSELAWIYLTKKDDYARAEPLAQRIAATRERILGPDDPDTMSALGMLALLYGEYGEYARAKEIYRRVLDSFERTYGKDDLYTGRLLVNMSLVYQYEGDYAGAARLAQRALQIFEARLGPNHNDVGAPLHHLAILSLAQGDSEEAVRLLSRIFDINEGYLERVLATGSENHKRKYLESLSFTRAIDEAVSLHLRFARDNGEAARLALTIILRRKGRLLDVMTDQIGGLRRHLGPQESKLLGELLAVYSQRAALMSKGGEQADPAHRQAEVARLEAEKDRLESEVSTRNAEFRQRLTPVTLESVQHSIPAGAALVEFISYSPSVFLGKIKERGVKAEPRYAAYVLRREGEPMFVELGAAAPINQAVVRLRTALADPKTADVKRAARALDELVMRPVRRLFGEVQTVLLSPDGELNLVPFAALVDERGRYLVQSYTINYLTSGRDLLHLGARTGQRQQPLVIANPDFDTARTPGGRRPSDKTAGRRSIDFSGASISPLPGTAQEAAAIQGLLPAARVLTEGSATEAALKQVAGPRILHIATHGFFLKDQTPHADGPARELVMDEAPGALAGENPLLRSGLVLAGVKEGQSGAGEDGVLTALEVAGLDLWGTELVVLSACETGVGDVAKGEGVYGLRRALVLAGSASQLISLWKVSDAATKDLMVEYYRRLQAGEGRAAALRAAQLTMLTGDGRDKQAAGREFVAGAGSGKTADYSHPFYWASFIPVGDWRTLDGAPRPSAATPRPGTHTKPSGGSKMPEVKRPESPKQAAAKYDASAWVRQGQAYLGATPPDYDGAIDAYRRALSLDPRYEDAWQGIAAAALRKGSALVARDAITQLTALNPSNPSLPGLRAEMERLHAPAMRPLKH